MKSDDKTREARWAEVNARLAAADTDIARITGEILADLSADPEEFIGSTGCICGGTISVRCSVMGGYLAECTRVGCGRKHADNAETATKSAVSQAVNLHYLSR